MADSAWLTLEGRSTIECPPPRRAYSSSAGRQCGCARSRRAWVVVHVRRLGTLTSGPAALPPKEEEMNSDQARANLELVFNWIDALRRGDIEPAFAF
jgi:hypothetical protein